MGGLVRRVVVIGAWFSAAAAALGVAGILVMSSVRASIFLLSAAFLATSVAALVEHVRVRPRKARDRDSEDAFL